MLIFCVKLEHILVLIKCLHLSVISKEWKEVLLSLNLIIWLCKAMTFISSIQITVVICSSAVTISGLICLAERSLSERNLVRTPMQWLLLFCLILKVKKWVKQKKALYGLILKKLHLMISSSTGEMLMTTMLLSVLKCWLLYLLKKLKIWKEQWKVQSLIRLKKYWLMSWPN